jgi:hypothetical protein
MCRDTTEYDTLPNDAGIAECTIHHCVAATFCYYSGMQQCRSKSSFLFIYEEVKSWGEMPGEGLGVGGDTGEGEGEPPHLHHLLHSHTLQI